MLRYDYQRKFLVRGLEWRHLPSVISNEEITDAYLSHSNGDITRFRIKSDIATITTKSGVGIKKKIKCSELSLKSAHRIIDHVGGIKKHRKVLKHFSGNGRNTKSHRNGKKCYQMWNIDSYLIEPNMPSLIIAECLLKNVSEEIVIPPWLSQYTEITNHFSGYDLCIALLQGRPRIPEITNLMLNCNIPHIAITGAPCSGKTTILDMLERLAIGQTWRFIPEMATQIISTYKCLPPSDPTSDQYDRFQKILYNTQISLEDSIRSDAAGTGKQAIIIDRGICDIVSYLPKGKNDYKRIFNHPHQDDYGRYDLVICLDLPSRNTYNQNKLSNAARTESYSEAKKLRDKILNTYKQHKNFVVIPATTTMEQKMTLVLNAIFKSFPLLNV